MAEYSANAVQTVNPGESIIFTDAPVPCTRGLVRHRDETGSFLLRGDVTQCACCGRRNRFSNYLVDFGANIAIPEGGTVGPISVAIAIDGATIPASDMIVTPAAVEDLWHVNTSTTITVPSGCCVSVSAAYVDATEDDAAVTPTPSIFVRRLASIEVTRVA